MIEEIVVLPKNRLCHRSVDELDEVQDQKCVRRERLTLRQEPVFLHAGGFEWPSQARHLRRDRSGKGIRIVSAGRLPIRATLGKPQP